VEDAIVSGSRGLRDSLKFSFRLGNVWTCAEVGYACGVSKILELSMSGPASIPEVCSREGARVACCDCSDAVTPCVFDAILSWSTVSSRSLIRCWKSTSGAVCARGSRALRPRGGLISSGCWTLTFEGRNRPVRGRIDGLRLKENIIATKLDSTKIECFNGCYR